MPEYVMGVDEDRATVARRLLTQAGERADQVTWQPRADVPGGGVFLLPDDVADEVGRQATTEHGTPKDAAKGEYPYDGNEGGDPERRDTDLAQQDAEDDEDAAADEVAGEQAAAEDLPRRRRRATPSAAQPANTTEQ